MLKIVVNPRLQIRKETAVIVNTYCLYVNLGYRLEKNSEIDVIRPTHVVRQAIVKMAANKIAPTSPNTSCTI